MEYPFGRNQDGVPNISGYGDQVSMKERHANTRRGDTRIRLLMQIIWLGPRDGLKEDITAKWRI